MEEVAWQMKGQAGLASGALSALTPNIWRERAAKHNTVLLATILPSKVLTFWRAENLKQNHDLILFLKRKVSCKIILTVNKQ